MHHVSLTPYLNEALSERFLVRPQLIHILFIVTFSYIMSLINTSTEPRRTRSDFGDLVRSDFWFVDGNIVIIAGPAAFKVHRGQLERHSEVFDGLFSVPQPQKQELFDGCLWVELHDCPSDVFYFLGALYDGLCVPSFLVLQNG